MADSESILQLGIEAARAGDKMEARDLFRLVTREDPNNAQGWLWLAGVAEDREEKRAALEHVIQIDPNNELARKGLAALTGRTTAAIPVVDTAATPPATPAPSPEQLANPSATASTTTTSPPSPPATPALPDRASSGEDLAVADSLDSTRPNDQADVGGAKAYTTPAAGVSVGAARTSPGDWTSPDFGDDAYDLSDYQNRPQVSPNDAVAMQRDEGGKVVVDDGPQHNGLPPWVYPLVGVLAIVLIGAFLFKQCAGGNTSVVTAPTRTTSGTSVAGGVPEVLGTTGTFSDSGTLGTNVGPTITESGTPGGSASTGPATGFDATLPPGKASASPAPVVETAGAVQTAAVGQTTIIIEGSGTAQSGAQTAASTAGNGTLVTPPAKQTQPAQGGPPPNQTAVVAPTNNATVTGAPNPPATNGDVTGANPQNVPSTQRITANAWNYVWNYGFGQLKTVGTSAYGGARPTRGQWIAITMAAANTSGQPTKIPDGFFVLKDAQNRVYDFNRAASVDWFNRFGGRGVIADINANDPFTTESASTILLFDIPADASNLVLFSRDNVNQGYLIR